MFYLYLAFVASIPYAQWRLPEREAAGVFAIEVTLTFDAGPDIYTFDETSAEVRFEGRNLLQETETIRAGEPIVISPVAGIAATTADREGRNELLVSVSGEESPPDEFSAGANQANVQRARAIRVRVLRDGEPLADETYWSEPDGRITGTLEFVVKPIEKGKNAHSQVTEAP